MKRLLISSLFGIVVVLAPFALHAAEEGKTEIDGTWEVISYNDNGKEDAKSVKSEYIAVRQKGVQTITKEGKPWKERRYSVNPKANPKEITVRDPRDGKITSVGIYEIKGDTMKIAVFDDKTQKAQERPKDFSPSKGKKVITYRRVGEKTEIDGVWELIGFSRNNKEDDEAGPVEVHLGVEKGVPDNHESGEAVEGSPLHPERHRHAEADRLARFRGSEGRGTRHLRDPRRHDEDCHVCRQTQVGSGASEGFQSVRGQYHFHVSAGEGENGNRRHLGIDQQQLQGQGGGE